MDATLDFTRWTGKPRGLPYRRWVITSTGLRQVFRKKFFQFLVLVAWAAGFAVATLGFFFSQSIAPGGWLEQLGAKGGPRSEAVVQAFTGYVLLYPDVVIHGFYTVLFWAQAIVGQVLSLLALTVVVPNLITRDRAGQALTMYLSRPLTSLDYLIGKTGIVVGILLAVWTGPLLFGWLLCTLFAPDMTFVTYSLLPLGRALLFNGVSLVVLATIAMGVSAVSKTTSHTTLWWLGAWMLVGGIGKIPFVPEWIRSVSFTHDLDVLSFEIFRPHKVLEDVFQMVPLVPAEFINFTHELMARLAPANLAATVVGLVVLIGLSSLVFFRRLRPE